MTGSYLKTPAFSYMDVLSGKPIPDKSFYILSGTDLFIFSEMEKVFREKFLPDDPSGYNFARYNCDENIKIAPLISICEEYPFGSKHKLVILRNAHSLKVEEGEKIRQYLENPSPATILVLTENPEEVKTLSGSRFVPSRDLKKAMKKYGFNVQCSLTPQQIRQWTLLRFEKEGKSIDRHALDVLLESVGSELWDIHQEIIKISLYTGKKNNVTLENIEAVTSHRPQTKIYNLTEHVGAKNCTGALFALSELLKEKMTGVQILAVLNNHLVFLNKIGNLLEQGENSDSIAKKLHRHPYYISKCISQARNYNRKSLEMAFDVIARADWALKSGIDERLTLELVLIQLCRSKN